MWIRTAILSLGLLVFLGRTETSAVRWSTLQDARQNMAVLDQSGTRLNSLDRLILSLMISQPKPHKNERDVQSRNSTSPNPVTRA